MTSNNDVLSGQLSPRTKKCRFCQEEILISAQKCKHCGEFLSPAARRAAGLAPVITRHNSGKIEIPYGPAIFSLLMCLPLGVISLIYAIQADSKMKAGDIVGAEASARVGRTVGIVGMLLGLVFLVLYVMK